jgi:hypothetical protein
MGHNTHYIHGESQKGMEAGREETRSKEKSPLSLEGMGIKRELRLWVVLPRVFCIEETP